MDDLQARLRARKRGGGFKHTLEDGVNVLTHTPAPDPLCQEAADALAAKDALIRGLLELIDAGAAHEPQVLAARAALTDQ